GVRRAPARVGGVWHDQYVFPSTSSARGSAGPGPSTEPGPSAEVGRTGEGSRSGRAASGSGRRRREASGRRARPRGWKRPDADAAKKTESRNEPEPVPVRPLISVAIAGFAALLGIGLVFGAETAGPGSARIPFAVVVFGVQALYVASWTKALRPPASPIVMAIGVLVALAADAGAVMPREAGLAPLAYVAAGGFVAAVLAQLVRPADRARVTASRGSTMLIRIGVVAFAMLLVLSRIPIGTQAIFVSLAAATVSLMVARLIDAVLPRSRLAPQVP